MIDIITGGGDSETRVEFFSLRDLELIANDNKDKVFKFVGTNLSPCDIGCWRGSYDIPSFTYSDKPMTGGELSKLINKSYDKEHIGYKGGEYWFSDCDVFYVAPHGYAHEYAVFDVEIKKQEVILKTKINKY